MAEAISSYSEQSFIACIQERLEFYNNFYSNEKYFPNGKPIFRCYSISTLGNQSSEVICDYLTTLAAYLEYDSYEYWHGLDMSHYPRRLIYDPTRNYDSSCLKDFKSFCSVFLDF